MNHKKVFLLMIGLIAVLSIFFLAPQALAGEPAPVGFLETHKIIGPTMWAVGVCQNPGNATLRVKKVEDCNIDTDSQYSDIPCPINSDQLLYYLLAEGSVFGLPCRPIITKVKNWKDEGDIVSFDAQINFYMPNTYIGSECTPPPAP